MLTFIILLFCIIGSSYSLVNYPGSYTWSFIENSHFAFNDDMFFTMTPKRGINYDPSLVGYWNMNEATSVFVRDSSGNGNDGTLVDANYEEGKYDEALRFNGLNSFVDLGSSKILNCSPITISAWVKLSTTDSEHVIYRWRSYGPKLSIKNGYPCFSIYDSEAINYEVRSLQNVADGLFHFLVGTYDGNDVSIYIDGKFINSNKAGVLYYGNGSAAIGREGNYNGGFFNGLIDEVCIYNRSISEDEVATLNVMGPLPNPIPFANYYNFLDPTTNNTMLLHINNLNSDAKIIALTTCTKFFTNKTLEFQSNSSVIINIWTNLGEPIFTTGIWNAHNYTTTLNVESNSNMELNWNRMDINNTSQIKQIPIQLVTIAIIITMIIIVIIFLFKKNYISIEITYENLDEKKNYRKH